MKPAIFSVVQRPVRELWVGKRTIQSIVGQFFFPSLLDRLMVNKAWEGQLTAQAKRSEKPDDLYSAVRGEHSTRGTFSAGARQRSFFNVSADLPGKVASRRWDRIWTDDITRTTTPPAQAPLIVLAAKPAITIIGKL